MNISAHVLSILIVSSLLIQICSMLWDKLHYIHTYIYGTEMNSTVNTEFPGSSPVSRFTSSVPIHPGWQYSFCPTKRRLKTQKIRPDSRQPNLRAVWQELLCSLSLGPLLDICSTYVTGAQIKVVFFTKKLIFLWQHLEISSFL